MFDFEDDDRMYALVVTADGYQHRHEFVGTFKAKTEHDRLITELKQSQPENWITIGEAHTIKTRSITSVRMFPVEPPF